MAWMMILHMRSKKVGIGLFLLSLIGYGIHWAFFDMERLPKGTVLAEQVSPDGTYTVRAYLSDMGRRRLIPLWGN